jgi:tRNA U34 2-thiouridine synthase MnmA/TrmU
MKAIGLLSGGLDSTLAVRLIREMGSSGGCQVHLAFLPVRFRRLLSRGGSGPSDGLGLKTIAKGDDYLDVVRHPKHGYGVAMNPCIDCRIFMFSRPRPTWRRSVRRSCSHGEVLGQRPMSQHRRAMDIIESEAGAVGKIVRPLSAQHLEPSEAERKGWVDRAKLLDFHGRTRKPQLAPGRGFGLKGFACPAAAAC